jgi:hypothetical protein
MFHSKAIELRELQAVQTSHKILLLLVDIINKEIPDTERNLDGTKR